MQINFSSPPDFPKKKFKKRLKQKVLKNFSENQFTKAEYSYFALLIHNLKNLPKVLPSIAWQDHFRGYLANWSKFNLNYFWFRFVLVRTLVLSLITGLVFNSLVQNINPALAEEIGEIAIQAGNVYIQAAEAENFILAQNGDPVSPGDSILVAEEATASIEFHSANTITLAAGTKITITEQDEDNTTKVALVAGQVETQIENKDEQLELTTSAGPIVTNDADVSIEIDKKTGLVAVQPRSALQNSVASNFNPSQLQLPEIAALALELDFIQIYLSRAIRQAQQGNRESAMSIFKIALADEAELARIFDETAIVEILPALNLVLDKNYEESLVTAKAQAIHYAISLVTELNQLLEKAITNNYPVSSEQKMALDYLAKVHNLANLAYYYFIDARTLTNQSELPTDYQPAEFCENLFSAVRALQLAHTSAHSYAEELIALNLAELQLQLATGKVSQETLLEALNEPIYLPVLAEFKKQNAELAPAFAALIQDLQSQI